MLPRLPTMYDSEVSYFNYQFASTPVTLQIRTQKYSSHSLHDVCLKSLISHMPVTIIIIKIKINTVYTHFIDGRCTAVITLQFQISSSHMPVTITIKIANKNIVHTDSMLPR